MLSGSKYPKCFVLFLKTEALVSNQCVCIANLQLDHPKNYFFLWLLNNIFIGSKSTKKTLLNFENKITVGRLSGHVDPKHLFCCVLTHRLKVLLQLKLETLLVRYTDMLKRRYVMLRFQLATGWLRCNKRLRGKQWSFFSKFKNYIFGYFDLTNNFFDNKNKYFLGWPKRYFG